MLCGGGYDLRGRDRLSDVALGVVGAVDDEPGDGGRKLLATDAAWFGEVLRNDGADAYG